MAIDNRRKRQSVVGINRFAGPSVVISEQNQQWRQAVGYSYLGILAAGAEVDAQTPIGHVGGMLHDQRLIGRSLN